MNQKEKRRGLTERSLLAALGTELLSDRRLTAEGVAAAAAVNKALLYRYFGGLPGLVAAYASSAAFMPDARELLALCPPDIAVLPARERFLHCIKAYIALLADRPVTVQILLRLSSFDRRILKALQAGRRRGIKEVRTAFGGDGRNPGFDPDLAFSLVISGACCILGSRRASWTGNKLPAGELAARLTATVEGLMSPGDR